jgi:hypothetical protein
LKVVIYTIDSQDRSRRASNEPQRQEFSLADLLTYAHCQENTKFSSKGFTIHIELFEIATFTKQKVFF